MRRQAPTAMIANWAETVPQFMTPSRENMPDSGVTARKKRNTAIVPQIAASSGRINALRIGEMVLTRWSVAGVAAAF
jgi:hypothetical protein